MGGRGVPPHFGCIFSPSASHPTPAATKPKLYLRNIQAVSARYSALATPATAAPSRNVTLFPEIAGTRSPGTRIPTRVRQTWLRVPVLNLPHLGYPATISFGSFNQKCRLSSQRQQVLIAAHQEIGFTALGQVEKRLIVGVPAHGCASFRQFDQFAVRKILGQQFSCVVRGEPEFRVTENPREFGGGCARDKRNAATFAPMLAEPSQAAIPEEQR